MLISICNHTESVTYLPEYVGFAEESVSLVVRCPEPAG